jgi:hypothetical protein
MNEPPWDALTSLYSLGDRLCRGARLSAALSGGLREGLGAAQGTKHLSAVGGPALQP